MTVGWNDQRIYREESEAFFRPNYEESSVNENIEVATPTRFELAISALTGLHDEPLHHGAA